MTRISSDLVSPSKMNRSKKFTIITFCVVNLSAGALYSVIAPFFPTEASKKGVSATMIGLVFAAYELTIMLASPILGTCINQIGAKFMYVSGTLICGVAVVIFGVLDHFEDRTTFIVMCFVVRCIEAVGAAAFDTALFAIVAHSYPDKVATMLGILETFNSIGLMVGAPIGGALFELGGFMLPFVILGSLLILVALASVFLLPSTDEVVKVPTERSVLSLFRIPIVGIVGLLIAVSFMVIGYRMVSLSVFLLDSFHLSPVWVGSVFLVGSATHACMASVWGYIGDKKPKLNTGIISAGSLIVGLSFFLMGPAPFFPFKSSLVLVFCTMISMSFGLSTQVISYKVVTEQTIAAGHVDCLATYGLISGYLNMLIAGGCSFGSLIGGYLDEKLGFEWSSVVFGSCSVLASFTLFVCMLVSSRPVSHHQVFKDFEKMETEKHMEEIGDPAIKSSNPKFLPLIVDSDESYESDESERTCARLNIIKMN